MCLSLLAALMAEAQQKLKQSEDACHVATAAAASSRSQASLGDRKAQMLQREIQSLTKLLASHDDEKLMSGERTAC